VREKHDKAFAGNYMAAEIYRLSQFSLQKHLSALWRRMRRMSLRSEKRLRLCENLPLGERRFVAVVEFGSERFLLGGTASSLVLLARLAGEASQADAEPRAEEEPVQTRLNALWSAGGAASTRRGEKW
jgi:hypothetical protein